MNLPLLLKFSTAAEIIVILEHIVKYNDHTRIGAQRLRNVICAMFLLGLFGESLGSAQEAPPAPSAEKEAANQKKSDSELAAIRAESQTFIAAFNKRDAKAIAALWTEDGEYIDDAGRRFFGRDEIEKGHSPFFANSPKVILRLMIDSLRLLSDAAAIEDGRAVVDPPPAGAPGVSKYTVVHVKVNGKWLMASVRDARIETPSTFENVADLEWLIGKWVAEEHGVKTESVCHWIGNKSFVERKYTTTQVDGSKTLGVQIIGWNPLDGHVQSWNFSPDGGHAPNNGCSCGSKLQIREAIDD